MANSHNIHLISVAYSILTLEDIKCQCINLKMLTVIRDVYMSIKNHFDDANEDGYKW